MAVMVGLASVSALPAFAQTEARLREAFEGQFIVVKMEMPATHKGVDIYPEREPSLDFTSYSQRVREFGVALREGDRVMVTAVRVKKKNVEIQLGGGGYGVFSDDTGSVYVPSVTKSDHEKYLEKEVKRETNAERRRRLQAELDTVRRDREREERRTEREKRELEAIKKREIASKRLEAGSRFNLWLPEERLAAGSPSPIEVRRMLTQYVDFDGSDRGRTASVPPPPPRRTETSELRRGLTVDEVHALLGSVSRKQTGKQGDLDTLTEWYEAADRVTEVFYVNGVVVKFSTASK
jgi:hypothetical protein